MNIFKKKTIYEMKPINKKIDSLEKYSKLADSSLMDINATLNEIDSLKHQEKYEYIDLNEVELIHYEPKDYFGFTMLVFFVFSCTYMIYSMIKTNKK